MVIIGFWRLSSNANSRQKGIILSSCSGTNVRSSPPCSFWPAITLSGCLSSQISQTKCLSLSLLFLGEEERFVGSCFDLSIYILISIYLILKQSYKKRSNTPQEISQDKQGKRNNEDSFDNSC